MLRLFGWTWVVDSKMRNSSLQHHYERKKKGNCFDGLSFYISWPSFFTKADPQIPFPDNTLFNIVVPKLSLSEAILPPPQWLGKECLNSPKKIFANSGELSLFSWMSLANSTPATQRCINWWLSGVIWSVGDLGDTVLVYLQFGKMRRKTYSLYLSINRVLHHHC